MFARLEFLLLFAAGGSLDGLHHAEATSLDGGNGVVLGLHEAFVGLLELLDVVLEAFFGVSKALFGFLDGSVEVIGRQGEVLLDGLLLVIVAKVEVAGAAAGAEVLVSELLECVEITATLVVFEVVGVTVLDGGEALDTVGVTEGLAGGGAVNVSYKAISGSFKLSHEFVPSRLHRLAVTSPRGLELDKNSLASSGSVPIVGGELGGRGECEEEREQLHVI